LSSQGLGEHLIDPMSAARKAAQDTMAQCFQVFFHAPEQVFVSGAGMATDEKTRH